MANSQIVAVLELCNSVAFIKPNAMRCSLSLICLGVEMKSKTQMLKIRTAVILGANYLRKTVLDSTALNVSAEKMMQFLWWWP